MTKGSYPAFNLYLRISSVTLRSIKHKSVDISIYFILDIARFQGRKCTEHTERAYIFMKRSWIW